jgi:hypothetical protein
MGNSSCIAAINPKNKGTMKTQKVINLKAGGSLPKGLPVTFLQDKPTRCLVHDGGQSYQVRITSAFKAPSMDGLEEMMEVCESVCGENVEPDGWDHHGSPSWLLALGMV